MSARRVEIRLGKRGEGRLVVDGHDLSKAIRAGTLQIRPGDLNGYPSVSFELLADEIDITQLNDAEPQILLNLPERTRAALLAMGWTSPGGES